MPAQSKVDLFESSKPSGHAVFGRPVLSLDKAIQFFGYIAYHSFFSWFIFQTLASHLIQFVLPVNLNNQVGK